MTIAQPMVPAGPTGPCSSYYRVSRSGESKRSSRLGDPTMKYYGLVRQKRFDNVLVQVQAGVFVQMDEAVKVLSAD